MAGRFLFQKLSSRISSRSRSLWLSVGAHASACDIAAPICRVSEGGSGALSRFLHGSAAHSSMTMPSNCVIHRCAARYFNTLSWTSSAAKTSNPTNGMDSAVAHHAKPAFVGSPGVKPTFSSNSRSKDTLTWEAKRAAWKAEMEAKNSALGYQAASNTELEAKNKAIRDDFKAWKTQFDKDAADFRSYFRRLVLLWTLLGTVFIVESSRRAYVKRKSSEIAANDNAVVEGPRAS